MTATDDRTAAGLHVSNGEHRPKCVECGHRWPCTTQRNIKKDRK